MLRATDGNRRREVLKDQGVCGVVLPKTLSDKQKWDKLGKSRSRCVLVVERSLVYQVLVRRETTRGPKLKDHNGVGHRVSVAGLDVRLVVRTRLEGTMREAGVGERE